MNRLRCLVGQLVWLGLLALIVYFLAELPA
jgi:hypothetical protein